MRNQFSKMSFQATLCILCVVITVYGISYAFILGTTRDISRQEQQFLSEIAKQNATIVKKTLELNLDSVEVMSYIIGRRGKGDDKSILEFLSMETTRSSFKRMGYADLNGNAFTTDGLNISIADRQYFYDALSGKSTVSERLIDKTSGDYINVYASPVYKVRNIIGVTFAVSETDSFNDILKTDSFDGQSASYIITRTGKVVARDFDGDNITEVSDLLRQVLGSYNTQRATFVNKSIAHGHSGILEYNKDNETMIGVYCSIGINDWYVVSVVPKSVISKSASTIILRNTLTVCFIAVLCFVLLAFIVWQNNKNRSKLEKIAYFDELLGIPNFNAFKEDAQSILEANLSKRFIFIKLDVKKFKLINDRFGFAEGDRVLKNISKAISLVIVEENQLFARVANDEFIVMLKDQDEDCLRLLKKAFLGQFYDLMGPCITHHIKFPSGRYRTNLGESSISTIFEKVNYAHSQAKLLPEQNSITEFYYDSFQKEASLRESELEDKMEAALINSEFVVYLQPKYELENETIIGAEALVRWKDPSGIVISPGEFIPLFERNGFITQLDLYMFEEVCKIISSWIKDGYNVVTVSVNFSRLHLLNCNFIDELIEIAHNYNIPNRYIELELTETVVFENIDILERVLGQLHQAGFTMSMDDFGTGYSSLGLLKTLNVDTIKMDRSFFVSDKNKKRTKAVFECIITMAQKLNIHTVAEGVEELEHIEFLKEVGCEVVQGYYYSKPMPALEFREKLTFL